MRKLEASISIDELRVSKATKEVIAEHGYDAFTIIMAARHGNLCKLDGIDFSRAKRITAAVDELGFIMHESEMSARLRKLLDTTFKPIPETASQYEARTEFTDYQLKRFLKCIDRFLSSREMQILKMNFGIGIGAPMTLEQIRKEFDFTRERARQYVARSLRRLRHPLHRIELMRIFPEWYGFASATLPYASIPCNKPLVEMTLDDLTFGLTAKTYRLLTAAGIKTADQLTRHTYAEILSICGLKSCADNVVRSLWRIGCTLTPEEE